MPKPRRKVYYAGARGSSAELLMSAATVSEMVAAGVDVGVGYENNTTHEATVAWLADSASGGNSGNPDDPNLTAATSAIAGMIAAERLASTALVITNLETGYTSAINLAIREADDTIADDAIAGMQAVANAVRTAYPNMLVTNWGTPAPAYFVPILGGEGSSSWKPLDDAEQGANQEEYITRLVRIVKPAVETFDVINVRSYPTFGFSAAPGGEVEREQRFLEGCMEIGRRLRSLTGKPIHASVMPVWRDGNNLWDANPVEGRFFRDTFIPVNMFGPDYIDKLFDEGADAVHIWWSATHAINAFSGDGANASIRNNRALVKYNLLDPQDIDPGDLSSNTFWQDAQNREAAFTYGQNFLAARAIETARRSLRADVRNAARQSTLDAGGIVIGSS